MEKLKFSFELKAKKEKVWQALWDDANYRQWTSVFFKGSYAVTENWKEGSTVLFLSPDGNGVYATIEKHVPNEYMAFKHLGNVKDSKPQPVDDETKKWSGAMEIYKLAETGTGCRLEIEIDTVDEYIDFTKKTFPKALEIIKTLSEK